MDVRTEAIASLRRAVKDGTSIGGLVNCCDNIYRQRSEPLTRRELIACFEEAFDLNIGADMEEIVVLHRGEVKGIEIGRATASIFAPVLENRGRWDPDPNSHDNWLDTLPSIGPIDRESFNTPQIREWSSLSEDSRKYIVGLTIQRASLSRSLRLIAALAERLQAKLDMLQNIR